MDGAAAGGIDMAGITFKPVDTPDPTLRQLQQNIADAVEQLANQPAPPLGVLSISAGRTLVGNEDVVLVDASQAAAELILILPAPRLLARRMTVHVIKAGTVPVTIKAVDIPSATSPTINGAPKVSIAPGQEGTFTVVSDGRVFAAY